MSTPADTRTHLLGTFPTYAAAEQVVDRLSDRGFPVQHVRIVGNGLRSVERVTGRMTKGRAAAAGASSGAWFGLLIGLLLGLLSDGSGFVAALVTGLLVGALWGAVFGFLAHAATGGRHDYSSVKTLEAQEFEVHVPADRADEAIRLAGLI